MNVKPGEIARVVDTRTPNDGAVVLVLRHDPETTEQYGFQWWVVSGKDLAGYVDIPPTPWPTSVADVVTVPDKCLRRIDPGQSLTDERRPVAQPDPIHSENACLTT